MSDYIRREDALEIIDKLIEIHFDRKVVLAKVYSQVKDMPSADVVEVVRCGQCEYRDNENQFCYGRGFPTQLVSEDGFCEKGKRRND